jgi:hypothetical protein
MMPDRTDPEDRRPSGGLQLPAWARELDRLDEEGLRTHLRGLPVERQVDLALAVGWNRRLRIIKASEQAGRLVKALPPEEVLLTVKGLGGEDALPIVAHTSPEQLRFLLDVELWKRDQVDAAKVIEWLHYLLACGEDKVEEFVTTTDPELVAIMLRKLLYLVPNEEGVTIPEGLPSIMPDEFFTILANYPEELENTRLLLRVLRQVDRNLFYKLLFLAYGAVDEEATETAYRWRSSRLEEFGLLDFDEAVEIYGYIGEDEARGLAAASGTIGAGAEEAEWVAPSFPVLLVKRRTRLYQLLLSLEDRALAQRLLREVAFSAGRLLVADAEHIGEIASMTHALTRFFALANVGLVFLAGDDREEALRVIERLPLREVFQVGFSRALDLKRRAAALAGRYWPEWGSRGFTFLDHQRAELMLGLLARVPQYVPPARDGEGPRDFETMEEVRGAAAALLEIEAVAEACFDRLGLPRPGALPAGEAEAGPPGEITFENVIVTGAVRLLIAGEFRIEPLSRAEVREMFTRMLERDPAGRYRLSPAARVAVLDRLAGATGLRGTAWNAFRGFVEAGLGALEQEVAGIKSWQELDPRYTRTLMLKKAQGGAHD